MKLSTAFFAAASILTAVTLAIAKEGAHLGRYEWAVPYLAALLILCFVLGIWSLKREKESKKSEPSAHNENRLENVGNPHVEQHFHFEKTPRPPTASQPPTREEVPSSPAPIKFLKSEQRKLSDFYKFAPDISVVAACFRNDTPKLQFTEFFAHVVYQDATGKECDDLARAFWIGEQLSTAARFKPGVTKKLAIFLVGKNGEPRKPLVKRFREKIVNQIVAFPDFDSEPLLVRIERVEIRLFAGRNPPIIIKLKVLRKNQELILVEA